VSVSIVVSDTGRTVVEALFDSQFDGVTGIRHVITDHESDDTKLQISEVMLNDQDWVKESQRQLMPVNVCNGLRIVAPWHDWNRFEQSTVIINPGMSFGTGHHETTLMCAKSLADMQLTDRTVVDYGCGSGVLAIIALRLGAKLAWGIDIDPDALRDSQDNAERNGVEVEYMAVSPDALPSGLQADVVVANLFADALQDLADKLTRLTRVGGSIVLSGLLQSQTQRVRQIYSQNFDLIEEHLGQWAVLKGKRRDVLH